MLTVKPSEQPDLYQRLDVEPSANPDEIKQAYRRMAFEWHPDKNPNDPSLHEEFIAVSKAYEVLSDSSQRAEYDVERARAQAKKPVVPVSTPKVRRPSSRASWKFRNNTGPTAEEIFYQDLEELLAYKKIYEGDTTEANSKKWDRLKYNENSPLGAIHGLKPVVLRSSL